MSDDSLLRRQVAQILSQDGPRPGWTQSAACAGPQAEADLFYPSRGDDGQDAYVLCATCPVRAQCLADAIVRNDRWGIWGGMTAPRRKALMHDLQKAAS